MAGEPDTSELLIRAAHRLRRHWIASLEPWNVAPHEFRAMRVIAASNQVRLSDIAHRLHIANRSVTEVVDSLEAKGLVSRSPSPDDRRAVVVTLTATGIDLVDELATARAKAGSQFLEPLSPADTATLHRLLTTIAADGDHEHHAGPRN
ncbi:MAG: MarR family winged helix-turn-helix transcriptional regulator [Beutenbergiaceae bacterium]